MVKTACQNRHNRFRLLRVESLEERQMLSVSPVEFQEICNIYRDDFCIADTVNIIEIDAGNLTASALQSAIETAKNTASDDLIVLRTTNSERSIQFDKTADELVIDICNNSGTVTVVAYGEYSLIINAKSFSRIFTVRNGNIQMGNLILTGGKALTDINGTLSTVGVGGAIANAGSLTLSHVVINENSVDCGIFDDRNMGFNSKGGGIYNAGQLLVINSTISNNRACSGQLNYWEVPAYGAGGGVYNETNATLELRNTTITGNIAEFGTKVIQPTSTDENEQPIPVTIELLGNGGGIYNFGATIISKNSVISDNQAWFGGGIASIYNTISGCITLTDSDVINNSAYEDGGGIYSGRRCSVDIQRSFIQGNTAGKNGGGINNLGSLSIIGSVLSGNNAGTNGGGIYSYGTYSSAIAEYRVNLVNSTITGNSAGITKNGLGGGLDFKDVSMGNTFTRLYIVNSILINNRVILSSDISTDMNLHKEGYCSGEHSLTTFMNWSNSDGNNYIYDQNISLFLRDYDFTSAAEGDYRIYYCADSQAIDKGSNTEVAKYYTTDDSIDLAGNERIQNNQIDLGAYEYLPVLFDRAFPTGLQVQEGCSFYLSVNGTDRDGNEIVSYHIDLNQDGISDWSGDHFWISSRSLLKDSYGRFYLLLAVENCLGQTSDFTFVPVTMTFIPSPVVEKTSYRNGQILRLDISTYFYGNRSGGQWTIDWGDGTEQTINDLSNRLIINHYYTSSVTATYNIILLMIDDKGNDNNGSYFICSNTVVPDLSVNELVDSNRLILSSAVLSAKVSLAVPDLDTANSLEQKNKVVFPTNWDVDKESSMKLENMLLQWKKNVIFDQEPVIESDIQLEPTSIQIQYSLLISVLKDDYINKYMDLAVHRLNTLLEDDLCHWIFEGLTFSSGSF